MLPREIDAVPGIHASLAAEQPGLGLLSCVPITAAAALAPVLFCRQSLPATPAAHTTDMSTWLVPGPVLLSEPIRHQGSLYK